MKAFVVGIAGGTGSGKTTLVRLLVERLGEEAVTLVEHDSYYHDHRSLSASELESVNYDHPTALQTSLLIEHLRLLRAGQGVDIPTYDFSRHLRRPETRRVHSRPIIIVEGILVLADSELRKHLDLKVFVETEADLRFIRRLQRDLMERGRTVDSVVRQYLGSVRPMHCRHVEPSKEYADLTVAGEGGLDFAVDLILEQLSPVVGDSLKGLRLP